MELLTKKRISLSKGFTAGEVGHPVCLWDLNLFSGALALSALQSAFSRKVIERAREKTKTLHPCRDRRATEKHKSWQGGKKGRYMTEGWRRGRVMDSV